MKWNGRGFDFTPWLHEELEGLDTRAPCEAQLSYARQVLRETRRALHTPEAVSIVDHAKAMYSALEGYKAL